MSILKFIVIIIFITFVTGVKRNRPDSEQQSGLDPEKEPESTDSPNIVSLPQDDQVMPSTPANSFCHS